MTGERGAGECSQPHPKMTEERQSPKATSCVPMTNVTVPDML